MRKYPHSFTSTLVPRATFTRCFHYPYEVFLPLSYTLKRPHLTAANDGVRVKKLKTATGKSKVTLLLNIVVRGKLIKGFQFFFFSLSLSVSVSLSL